MLTGADLTANNIISAFDAVARTTGDFDWIDDNLIVCMMPNRNWIPFA